MESQAKNNEIRLELEVRQCSFMTLNLNCLKELDFVLTEKIFGGYNRISIGEVKLDSNDLLCTITKKPCILHPGYNILNLKKQSLKYHLLDRCPSSEDCVKKYRLTGVKKVPLLNLSQGTFHTSKIEEIP